MHEDLRHRERPEVPDPGDLAQRGLTAADVADRVARGQVNDVPDAPSRTFTEILRANLFTKFNALIGSLWAIVMICGAYRDALFGGVVVANTLIGIIQELRAKRTLDRLTVVNAPKVMAVRDGEIHQLAVNELVLDDVMDLRPGQQIVADSTVLAGTNLEVDESLLTGESDPVVKAIGDDLMSGSFVVSGSARAQVSKVGADAYAAQLAEEARRFTLVHSALRAAMDRIVTLVTYALVPTGIALFISQLDSDGGVRDGLVSAVGGVVAMVPEGLILLTSVAFTVGVLRLAKRRTLVQELPAIEVLARVDVICLDKTGTITSGAMDVTEVRAVDGTDRTRAGDRRGAGGARVGGPQPERHAAGAATTVRRHLRLDDERFRRLLVGPQVERVLLRRPGHVGVRRPGDGGRRQRVRSDRIVGLGSGRQRPSRAAPRVDRRAARGRVPARRRAGRRPRDARGSGAPRRQRDAWRTSPSRASR